MGLVVEGRHRLCSGAARGDHCEIIAELGEESKWRGEESRWRGEELFPLGRDPRLQDVPGLLMLVDGTLLSAVPTMMAASLRKGKTASAGMCWAGERRGAAGADCEMTAAAPGLVPSHRARR